MPMSSVVITRASGLGGERTAEVVVNSRGVDMLARKTNYACGGLGL